MFAPTDEAFELFLTEANLNLTTVLANKELLTEVLKYHVSAARYRCGAAPPLERTAAGGGAASAGAGPRVSPARSPA